MAALSPQKRTWRIAHSEASLGWGGQEHRILAEIKGFHSRGSEVWLIAPMSSQIYQRATQAGLPVLAQRFDQRYLLPFHILKLAWWLHRQRIEIVNPHSSRDGWLLTIAARIARVPLIIRSRHFDVPIPNKSLSRLIYKEWTHHILTTSPKITSSLTSTFDLDPGEITTLPTGVDLERFKPEGPKADFSAYAKSPPMPLIGMVTVIRAAKGIQILAEAVHLLKTQHGIGVHCIIAGEGPAREYVEAVVSQFSIGNQFTFLGHREDIPEIMRTLDIIAIPSFHEAIPQSGLQALAMGVPVVASDVGGIPSIIKHGETGRLVPPHDAPALAAAIRETLEQKLQTQEMCRAGQQFVVNHCSLSAMLDRLDAIYRQHLVGC
ncbi:glycosyltransferase [Prosthecobacter sp.]|uniref:glycosyltransferase n=1 Tax=Prosthecobacter sp. TaxID=1965333 RepID=UPI00248A0161|nr:glycosyltransferase [Prosthecobacter sp.]MDI1315489.1 glycosyltransferase [Prosthecobacter sp.]